MRKISPKKRGSKVGFVPDPFRYRQVWFESGLEEAFAFFLIAHPDVVEIREQQRVDILDGGRIRSCFVDFLVVWAGGARIAYEVKYRQDVAGSGIERKLSLICEQVGDAFADEYRLLTEQDLHPVSIENARTVVSAGADWDDDAREAVRKCLRRSGPLVRMAGIAASTGLGHAGYRAAISLLQEGALAVSPGDRLSPETIMANRLGRLAA